MADRSGVDAAVSGQYPEVGQGALPVKDVGRLLLRCGDRPGLVAAVSECLADAGANIVSLDQHSTEQSGGTFVQRTNFHLPRLTAARDALEPDFGDRVRLGADVERAVLSRAVLWHCEDRIIRYGNQTIVF